MYWKFSAALYSGNSRLLKACATLRARMPRMPLPDFARYAQNTLTAAELTRATFTVTDLSAHPLDFVLPLLPAGQSCIIGVTRGPDGGFRLSCGFDHRVTEGGEVAQFLAEVRERLLTFGTAQTAAVDAACDYCGRTASEAVGLYKTKGLMKVLNGRGDEALCCASCWNGW